jgi:LysM repeat protein
MSITKRILTGMTKPKGTRAAKEIEASKKNRETISRLANQKRIAQAGQKAVAPTALAAMKKSAKRRGSNSVIQANKTGKIPVNEMTKLQKQEYDFDKFDIGLQRYLKDKARKGEPAKYKGTDYSFMLSERKGYKPEGEKKALKERQQKNVEEVKKRQAGTVNKREGGKINTSKSPTDAMRAKLKGRVSTGTSKSSPAAPSLTTPKETSPKKTFTKKKEFMYGDKLPKTKPKAGQSPTDAMRQTGPGRQVLDSANRAVSKYTVKSGDTLSEIAKAKGTTVRAIMKASGIENANKIRVGQNIVIPDDVKRKGPYGNITDKELKSGEYDTGTVKRRIGGTVGKPKGCGAAQRGYGKAMKGNK